MNEHRLTFWAIALKTIVVHTITYFVIGALAFVLFNYSAEFADPRVSSYMRQVDDPLIAAGPLFQPIRGILFGLVFYLLRDVLFHRKNGWLIMWIVLVALGILSTFGPAPGSVEGMIYTTVPIVDQLIGLREVLVQSLLFSVVLCYWVNHPEKRALSWLLGILFVVILLLSAAGAWARYTGIA